MKWFEHPEGQPMKGEVWNSLTEGQRMVAAYRMGTIDGPEALAAAIDARLALVENVVEPVRVEPEQKPAPKTFDMQTIRQALLRVQQHPHRRPVQDDDLSTFLVNGGWAQPSSFIDIFATPQCLRNEWRLSYKGEAYMSQYPATIDELSAR